MQKGNTLLDQLPFDPHLRRETARGQGYEWVMDIGAETPSELWEEIKELVTQDGYKVGQASDRWVKLTDDTWLQGYRGLYKPLK